MFKIFSYLTTINSWPPD